MSFAESGFAQFMSTPAGRVVRVVVGLALIAWGFAERGSATGIVLMIVGLIPLTAGAFDLCYISVLLGGPIAGREIRACGRKR